MVNRMSRHKILITRLILFVYLFSTLFSFNSKAAVQSGMLGEAAALGSPLVSSTFTVENWNVWEMLCFGIFLSNFCQPFEDDYASAFTEGVSTGSKGRGLKALQFAAGGDATASGYLADMVNYCKEAQAQPFKNIYVNYSYWEYGDNVHSNAGSPRRAYLDDLFPQLLRDMDNITLTNNETIISPAVVYSALVGDYDDIQLGRTIADKAVLPTFYTDTSMNSETVIFDMTENWDIQILKALFAKTFNKNANSNYAEGETVEEDSEMAKSLDKTLQKYLGQTCPLVMDTFGNICMVYNNRCIVVIPGSANQHLTAKDSYNYVNSLILNNFVMSGSESEANIAGYGVAPDTEYYLSGNSNLSVGNFPVGHTDKVKDGRLLITADTDTVFMREVYKQLRGTSANNVTYEMPDSTVTSKPWGDKFTHNRSGVTTNIDITPFTFGKYFTNLADIESRKNQALQIHITGAECHVQESTGVLFWKEHRNQDEITIDTALGAYGILSTMFGVEADGKDVLDYFYSYEASKSLEDTKVNLFDGSYYLTPTIHSQQLSSKLFFNYYFHMMANDGTFTIDTGLQNIYDEAYRNRLFNSLRNQDNPKDLWITLLSTYDVKKENSEGNGNMITDVTSAPANPLLKSFVSHYWQKRVENYTESEFIGEDLTVARLQFMFDSTKSSIEDMVFLPTNLTGFDAPTRLIKVYKPSGMFSALSGVFGLEDGCQFELYSTYIYVTYLDFYGLLGGNKAHGFNEELFKDGGFKTFTGDNFKNGLTKEQMEDQVKLNTFKLLSLTKDGEEYRSNLFKSIIKTSIVEPLDVKMNRGGVGNVGAETGFLDVKKIEDNFLIGDLVKSHWGTISIILFGALSLLAIVSGALNNKSIGWYLTILVASSSMVYSIPFYMNLAPTLVEKYINGHFANTGGYWALAESVEYDKNQQDLAASGDTAANTIAIMNTLNFLDTDSSLMVKLDISQKVISVTALDYNQLQQMTTTRWLLPSIMKQMSSTKDNFDYVSVPVVRLYDNFASLWYMYHGESDYMPQGRTDIAVNVPVFSLADKKSAWQDSDNGYRSTAPEDFGATFSTKSISRVIESEAEPTHTCFYMLKDAKIVSAYQTMNKPDGMTRRDWQEYAKNVVNHNDVGVAEGTFKEISNNILSELNNYNMYSNPIQQSFGYLWTTENLGAYFYLLVKDTFGEAGEGSGKNLPSLMMQLQGSTAISDSGEEVRTSFMHYNETGYERDVCDMEEVFTNLLPYMYQMMLIANGDSDTTGLLGKAKMDGNPYYANNYQSWMFRTNWVTKLYEDNLYAGAATMNVRDEEGNVVDRVTVANMSDPRCYPANRPMVFSEAQMHEQHLELDDLCFTERKILDFNRDVIKRWTTLLNYANTQGLTKEHVYRQMAMEALFSFNLTFTRDNLIVSAKTMYPSNFDLRHISLITIIRSLICNVTHSNNYMYGDVATSLYETYGFLFGYVSVALIYYMFLFFGLVRDLYMLLAFVSAVATLCFNFASTSKNKFKSMGGCMITSGLFTGMTILYYILINMMVGNPTVDTMVNFSTIASSRMSSITLFGTSLFILLLTLGYTAVIVAYFYELWIGHKFGLSIKDGGFGFYYQLADKASKAIVGATERMGSKVRSTIKKASQFGPGADKGKGGPSEAGGGNGRKKGEGKVTNRPDEPIPVTQEKRGRGNRGPSIESSIEINENFTSNVTAGEDRGLTDSINQHINASKKKEASYANAASVENTSVNNTNQDVEVVNVVHSNNVEVKSEKDDAFAKDVEKRIHGNS